MIQKDIGSFCLTCGHGMIVSAAWCLLGFEYDAHLFVDFHDLGLVVTGRPMLFVCYSDKK